MLNLYDYTKFVKTPTLRTVHRKAQKALPELGMLPNVLIPGTGYLTPVLKERADGEIFVPVGEGVISSRDDYDEAKNETLGVDFKVEGVLRAEDQEGNFTELAGASRFAAATVSRYRTAFERIVKQLYLGTNFEEKGFKGFPGAVKYRVDAQKKEWNLHSADFDWSSSPTRLYSVFLIRAAASASVEEEGAKWIWGNNKTIAPTTERRVVDLRDEEKSTATGKNATYEGLVQHHNGQIGFGFTSDIDVIEICNVPSFRVEDFFLENVISQALTIFPSGEKANRIVIHKLCQQAMWMNAQNQTAGSRNVSIVPPKDEGGFSIKTPYFFDGTENIPIVVSEVMPSTGLQTGQNAATLDAAAEDVYLP